MSKLPLIFDIYIFHDDVIKWKHFPRNWPLCGEFTGPGEFPTQRPVARSFGVFFDLRLNKRLSKQPWGWWFETPLWSLWCQCNAKEIPLLVVVTVITLVTSIFVETETETSLFNTTWHYTDAWYQTYMTVLMYYSELTWYQILACMLGDLVAVFLNILTLLSLSLSLLLSYFYHHCFIIIRVMIFSINIIMTVIRGINIVMMTIIIIINDTLLKIINNSVVTEHRY